MKHTAGLMFWVRAVGLVVVRPHLWATALRQGRRLARPEWWRHRPYLPLPDAEYLEFRFETQYGADARPDPSDLITYLEWCRSIEAGSERSHRS